MYVNQYLFYALCILATPTILFIFSLILIPFWPRSDDKRFIEKNDFDKFENSNSL